MNLSHTINRRQYLLATAGAAVIAVSPTHRVGAVVDIYRVTGGALNLRSGPGLSYSVLAVLAQGTTMEIIDAGATANGYDWVEVWVSSLDKTGFVASTYLEKVTSAPPVSADFAAGSTAVTTAALNIRSGAGLSYPVIVALWVGAPVTVTGAPVAANGYTWYPIKTAYGTTGWVAGSFLTAGTASAPGFAVGDSVVTSSSLNLRSGAGLSYTVVVVLWQGAPVTITGAPVSVDGFTWYPVKTGYGTTGWVAGEYLT